MTAPATYLDGKVSVFAGNCLGVIKTLADNSIDACVCDPPYHLQSIVKRFAKTGRTDKTRTSSGPHQRTANGFMNKIWDGGDIAFQSSTWEDVLRVLKPGAFLVAFSSTRTYHRMACAAEDAGFIIHPMLAWVFATGFPKAHKVELEGWEGWRYGAQALKPAFEPIFLGQKPFSESTGSANVARWGTGALNIDGCRIGTADNLNGGAYSGDLRQRGEYTSTDNVNGAVPLSRLNRGAGEFAPPVGRWPANICHDGSKEVIAAFPETGISAGGRIGNAGGGSVENIPVGKFSPGDPGFGDSGSAARFFYSAKADSDDRLGSRHPTVKPVDLLCWLARLITPPGGTILDPFSGTGTTGEAAYREGFSAILIEREVEYLADIARRMSLCAASARERKHESIKARGKTESAGPLFDGANA